MKNFVALLGVAAVVAVAGVNGAVTHHKSSADRSMGLFGTKEDSDMKHMIELEDSKICKHRKNGRWNHPDTCNRFILCHDGRTFEIPCSPCHEDAVTCPNGQKVFSKAINACTMAHLTTCETLQDPEPEPTTVEPEPEPEPTTTAPEPEPEPSTEAPPIEETEAPEPEPSSEAPPAPSTENPERPPQEGDDCDPELCKNIGYCQHYLRCDKDTGILVREECGQDLAWNPRGNGSIHGGNCDLFENIDDDVEEKYRKDEECLACFWREINECSQTYLYQAPGLTNINHQTLSCADGLVFSKAKETCQRCEDVKRSDGRACCEADK